MIRRLIGFASLFALLTGCSGPALFNALVPGGGYHVLKDVPYGEGTRRTLDVYVPDVPAAGVVVFLYGGRWNSGTKDYYRFVGQALASRGYATVIPDYRLYPEVRFPGAIEDGAGAITWTQFHARDFVPSNLPMFLLGHSAGAHTMAMLNLDPRWLAEQGLDVRTTISAAVGLAGPYDFLPITDPVALAVFGPGEAGPETQPITFVDGHAPPMLLIASRNDTTVFPRNTERLAARIRAAGGIVEERYHERTGHVGLLAAIAAPLRPFNSVLDEIDAFLRRYGGTPRSAP